MKTRTIRSEKAICRNCDERKPTNVLFLATRKSGGSFNRSHRNYRSRICLECAYKLVATATPGFELNDRWVIASLTLVVKKPSKIEDQSAHGVSVMKYTWPSGMTTVIADCQCFGIVGRVHTWEHCKLRRAQLVKDAP